MTDDNPYNAKPEPAKKTTTLTAKGGKVTRIPKKEEPVSPGEVPKLEQKFTNGVILVGRGIQLISPLPGLVTIHQAPKLGVDLDKAVQRLAEKFPSIKEWASKIPDVEIWTDLMIDIAPIVAAVGLTRMADKDGQIPETVMAVALNMVLVNAGIDLQQLSKEMEEKEQEMEVEDSPQPKTKLEELFAGLTPTPTENL